MCPRFCAVERLAPFIHIKIIVTGIKHGVEIQPDCERLKFNEVTTLTAGDNEDAVIIWAHGCDVDLRTSPHKKHLGVAAKARSVKTDYLLDPGLTRERMMNNQGNTAGIAAPRQATDFAKCLRH